MSLPPEEPGRPGAPSGRQDEPTYAAPTAWTQPMPPAGAPAPRRSRATIVLATLTVLLLLALAGMTALYLSEKNSADERIGDQKAQIADQKAQIEKLEGDLKAKNNEVTRTSKELDSTEACMKAVREFFKAVNANDEASGGRAALSIDRDCEGVDIKF